MDRFPAALAPRTSQSGKPRRGGSLTRLFGRGLAVLLPSIVTIWILWSAGSFLYTRVAEPINGLIRLGMRAWVPRVVPQAALPSWYLVTDYQVAQERERLGSPIISDDALREQLRARNLERVWNERAALKSLGLVVAVALVYFAGLALGGIIGRRVAGRAEAIMGRLPGFRQVYPHVKQLVETVFGEQRMAFRRVVMIEFPRPGAWALAFVTGGGLPGASRVLGEGLVTVFVPTTPTPFTGFTLTLRSSEAVDLDMSVDEAMRFMITGGVLVPGAPLGGAERAPARGAAA